MMLYVIRMFPSGILIFINATRFHLNEHFPLQFFANKYLEYANGERSAYFALPEDADAISY